ncbi:MAG: ABC transporter permease [Truepera sp.]|nr:ABC transporter permease [Truepera sp.]
MWLYFRRRMLTTIPVLLGVSLAIFLMLHLLPGDPVLMMLTEHRGGAAPTVTGNITQEMYDNMRRELGLDRPLPVQFGNFLIKAVQGDLGESFRGGQPVVDLLRKNLPHTVILALCGLVVALFLGLFLGILAALNRGRWLDGLTMTFAVVGVSMPSFWLGIMLLLIFALYLRILPAVGMAGDLRSLVLPSLALGISASAILARLARSSMVEVLQQDYVRTARAKGLRERFVVLKHALKNSLIPVLTVAGLQFGGLLSGAVVVEVVFGRPGIGQIVVNAVLEKDFPVVQGMILFAAFTYVLANLLVDLSYGWLDPRVRYS